jgi:hypothetical protein
VLCLKISWAGIILGLLIMFQGLRIALHKKIWLPKSLKRKILSGDRLARHFSKTVKFFKKLEKYIHPRGTIYQQHPLLVTFNGWVMMLGGLFLILPYGLHFIAGLGVFLLSLGLLEEDILWMITAYAVILIHAVIFFLR